MWYKTFSIGGASSFRHDHMNARRKDTVFGSLYLWYIKYKNDSVKIYFDMSSYIPRVWIKFVRNISMEIESEIE